NAQTAAGDWMQGWIAAALGTAALAGFALGMIAPATVGSTVSEPSLAFLDAGFELASVQDADGDWLDALTEYDDLTL
ncbi:MAG: hypothetical protein AAFV62_10665, partial [Pseudomonadota bacterium]